MLKRSSLPIAVGLYHVLADDPDSRSWLPGKQVERVTHRDFDIELLAKLGSSPLFTTFTTLDRPKLTLSGIS